MFIATLFTIAQTKKQPKCPSTDDWCKKMWDVYVCVHTHTHTHTHTMEYYSDIKNNEPLPFAATWLDLENIILIEVRQRKTNIYMISLLRGI